MGLAAETARAQSGNLLMLDLTGGDNPLRITQEHRGGPTAGANRITLTLRGDGNGGAGQNWAAAPLLASGLMPGTLGQGGSDNRIGLLVEGDRNLFALRQEGRGNRIAGAMHGHGNGVAVDQSGTGNSVAFHQDGIGNMIVVNQRSY